MKPDPKILDDMARMAGGALNVFSGLQQQIREDVRARFEDMANRLDLVPREDFDQLQAMVVKLRQRVDALEKKPEKTEKPVRTAKAAAAKKKARK